MLLDTVRVEYNTKGTKDKTTSFNPNDKAFQLQEEANKKALERRKQKEWTKVSLSNLAELTQP